MIKINGVLMPYPSSYETEIQDLDGETNRNAYGVLTRDRLRVLRKISLEFPPLSQAESELILNAIAPVNVSVEFPDAQLGMITRTMYAGNRTPAALKWDPATQSMRWKGLKFNLIEV